MAITIKHAKTDTIADWTQADLDAQIALGNFPPGTLLADIVLPSDWNNDHTISGTVAISNGGTGQTTANAAINALLPSQTSNNGKVLSTDGTNTSWIAAGGTGTVTSVALTAPSIFSVGGSPVTAAGTLALTYSGTALPVANGGSGATTLTGYVKGNGTSAFTASATVPSTDITGLGTMSTQNANSVTITGGTVNGTTIGATTATTGAFTTLTASTSLTTPTVQATNSGGLSLKNSAGTTQMSMGAGGGDNISLNVSTNLNGSNAQIDISPTGTGHVHINPTGLGSIQVNPTSVGTIDNMTIGATTPKNGSFVDFSVTGTTSFDGSQGTAGQVLTSAGTGATPTWTTPAAGTVTSVTGTAPVVSSGGTTPAISMAAASSTVNGYLTSTDWNTFNNKGSGTVTSVSATSPVTSTGGATPTIAMPAATTSVSGYLTSTDWTTFNNKGSGTVTSVAVTAPSIFSVAGSPITSSGTIALTYSGTALPIANGGTGQTTASAAFNALSPLTTSGDILYGATSGAGTRLGIGTTGQVLTVSGGLPVWSTISSGSGTVTSVSVVSANGFAGTVATDTTTPAITLTTSITGVLKGNGTALSAATSGTDYSAGTSALSTGILKSTTTTGALSIAVAADFPTLNQNTTGTAANVTGTVAIANGGTGQTTANAAYNALSPMTTTGDIEYRTAGSVAARLGIGTTGQVLTVAGGIPSWSTITAGNASYDTATTSTGYFAISAGTTAQRPASPTVGMIRYNTTESQYEVYISSAWKYLGVTSYPVSVSSVVIAGGGGAGLVAAGGGGAGGYRSSVSGESSGGGASAESPISAIIGTNYTVTVGAGGAASGSASSKGTNGSNSVFATVTSTGGGGGGSNSNNGGANGGSGGGARGGGTAGTGTANQGYDGGTSTGDGGGAGGGAGSVGGNSNDSTPSAGAGGAGVTSSITGSAVARAGGGGGNTTTGADGTATAGGGAGGSTPSRTGTSGTANTGGGGGGARSLAGGSGGSGVVILQYTSSVTLSNPGGGLTFTTATVGSNKVTTFTAGTGNIQFT